MACFWFNQDATCVQLPEFTEVSNVTYYKIVVSVGEVNWSILRRYSEFYELHSVLVNEHGFSKDILPSKKITGNKSLAFIESRRQALQAYLQKMLTYLKRTMPKVFVEFLNFHLYDVFFLLQNLSSKLFVEGEAILSSKNTYVLTSLELHAISECFKKEKALPAAENNGNLFDFIHALEFCSKLHSLVVNGSFRTYKDSNIILNDLPFELSAFKILTCLEMNEISVENIYSVGNLRQTLEQLSVHKTKITKICELLQCDILHKSVMNKQQEWSSLITLDLSNNNLTEIDHSISLAPNLKFLLLDDNKISCISDLSSLTNLVSLGVSSNLISTCDKLHTKVGNILNLNLSQNSLSTGRGLEKLYSLESLDLSCNRIVDIEEVMPLGNLPCLENLVLTGNPVATSVDYRIKVLELFGDRARDICLDNERSSQQELDKVSVLSALRIVREGKTPNFLGKR